VKKVLYLGTHPPLPADLMKLAVQGCLHTIAIKQASGDQNTVNCAKNCLPLQLPVVVKPFQRCRPIP
jgi:hypothetical protein